VRLVQEHQVGDVAAQQLSAAPHDRGQHLVDVPRGRQVARRLVERLELTGASLVVAEQLVVGLGHVVSLP
jgi:hypothetical protein